jgi:hypothetical protein
MAERMTSQVDAYYMKQRVNELADDLERDGFDRGQIGAVFGGIGLGMFNAHNGDKRTEEVISEIRRAIKEKPIGTA